MVLWLMILLKIVCGLSCVFFKRIGIVGFMYNDFI